MFSIAINFEVDSEGNYDTLSADEVRQHLIETITRLEDLEEILQELEMGIETKLYI